MALHWPVIENGDAPVRPMFPVMRARLLRAFTVSVPFVLWLTPMVQAMNAARAPPYSDAVRYSTSADSPVISATRAGVYSRTDSRSASKPVVCATM